MEKIKLASGHEIPMVGLGVFKAQNGQETEDSVKWALEAGYRHIDTAMIYGNEESVGKAIKESKVKREEIFITTKLWNEDIRQGSARQAIENSLKALQVDYIDLYLIHWPAKGFVNAWLEMEEFYKEGLVKSIGVSNFHKVHFDELLPKANIVPMVNQIESHPRLTNYDLINYCKDLNIEVQAWSPLGGGSTAKELLANDVLVSIGKKYNKSAAQVVIRWNIQRNVIVLPKSSNKDRIAQNIDVFDFELSKEDMKSIDNLNTNSRVGSHPENFNF